jgi:class 3 adenylate cyclase
VTSFAPDGAETRYASSDGVHIAYQVFGDGPVDIVHVPGWATHLELAWTFRAYARLLTRLASFARVVVFDKRGTGLSDPVVTAPTLDERMDDISAVMAAAGSEQAILFGECEGVPQSVLFAAAHPELTRSLVLYGSMPCVRDDGGPTWTATNQALQQVVDCWGTGRSIDVFAPSLAGSDRVRQAIAAYERASASPGMACTMLESLRHVDVSAAARSVHVPTVVLHRRDDFVPIESARHLAGLIPDARFVALAGTDHSLSVGDPGPVLSEIEEFVTGSRGRVDVDRVLMTVLFTDIVDSTGRAAALGDARWRELLEDHNMIVRRALDEYRGTEIKTVGDGFLATFDGPARAIRSAVTIAREVQELGIDVRAGLHTGETELLGDDIGGMAVNIAARVVGHADPGRVLVTGTVRDLVVGSGIGFTSRGSHRLKGVPGEWELLAITRSAGIDA